MKRWISVFILIVILSSTLVASAEEIRLTISQVMDLYNEQSIDMQLTDLNYLLEEITSEDSLDKYKELEDTLAIKETWITMYELEIEQFIEEGDLTSQEFIRTVNQLGQVKDQYLKTLESQLDSYMNMELLKNELENLSIQKNQELVVNEFDFQEYLYEYELVKLEYEILQFEKSILQAEIENAYVQLENGSIKEEELQDLENELSVLKDEEIQLESEKNKYYDTITYTLGIDTTDQYYIESAIEDIEILSIQELDEFLSFATSSNFDMNLLTLQEELYKTYLENINMIYDQDEEEYQERYVEYQLDIIKLEEEKLSIYLDLKTCYYNYENSFKEVNLETKKYDLYKENYKSVLNEHNLGVLSDLDLLEASYDYKKSNYDYYKKLVEYNEAKNQYLKSLYGIS